MDVRFELTANDPWSVDDAIGQDMGYWYRLPKLSLRTPLVGRDTFSSLTSALLIGPQLKKLAMSPSSAGRGGQYDTKYVTFE